MASKLVMVLAVSAVCWAIPAPSSSNLNVAMDRLTEEQMEAGSKDVLPDVAVQPVSKDPPAATSSAEKIEIPPPPPVVTTDPPTDAKVEPKPEAKKEEAKAEAKAEEKSAKKEEFFDIIVVSPTVRRFQRDGSPAPERYLAPMVDKMWYDMSPEQRNHVRFFILNSDKEPEKHEEAVGLATHPGVTLFTKMSKKEEIVSQAITGFDQLEDGRSVSGNWLGWVASENIDAAFLFEKAKHQAPYILFVEDDVMPSTQTMKKLNGFLQDFKHDDWLFLDLYTPNLNWAPGMLDVKNGERYNFNCCTQAMLFRSDRIDGVVQYLAEHAREPIDDNLRNYIRDYQPDLGVYAIRPNLFEHVGAYSSNKEKSTGIIEHSSLDFVPLLFQQEAHTK